MKRFALRLLLMACAFEFLLPMLPGVKFSGNFLHAIGAGIFFSLMAWVVECVALFLSAVLTISTMGLALLLLIPLWLVGFWFLPALVLKLTADLVPQYLSISGWVPAIWGGFVMLLIGSLTTDGTKCIRVKG